MNNLILSGGPYHRFEESSESIAELLAKDGIQSRITGDLEGELERSSRFDLLTINLLRWRMLGDRFDEDRRAWAFSLSEAARSRIKRHLEASGGILALHTAAICFDDWPEWRTILGGRWDWRHSSHPPRRPSLIHVLTGSHPIVATATDFEIEDEIYSDLELAEDVKALMTSSRRGVEQPLMWARLVGNGRVVYDALGHDALSITDSVHGSIIRRAAAWATGSL